MIFFLLQMELLSHFLFPTTVLSINSNNWTVVRLMVNLTQPAMLCFGKVPDDPVFRHHFLEVTSHLQAYKEVVWVFFPLYFLTFNSYCYRTCIHL